MSLPVVALVGRPNVGKSALFNRIIGRDAAIVTDEAGTTRDRHFAQAEWSGRAFWLVDTGGITDGERGAMEVAIRHQVEQAIEEGDMMVLVVDARAGMHPVDARIANLLREAGKPFIIAANKTDRADNTDHYEFHALGAGEPFPVSAISGLQSGDLLDELVRRIPEVPAEEESALKVAVVGRPNVGKSSFVNRLLGEERLVVSAEAGTTRDAIDTPMRYHGRNIVFIDTAGLRRQSRVKDGVEFYSALRTRRAIERSDVCCLMIDATVGLDVQDLKIANLVWEAGRGLVLVVNKWDLHEKETNTAARFEKAARERATFLTFVPFVFVSALTGQRVTRVFDLLLEVEGERQKRITTARVNERLGELLARRQPPQAAGREIKLPYATQVQVAPPTIAVFSNHPDLVEEHYVRYLHNGFRESWGFTGNPLRVVLRRKSA
ncbi:MAG: ribosome biogenesis GTPase Der [Gemmatimonadota bacterium]